MTGSEERRILVVAPTGRDGPLIAATLSSQGIACKTCRRVREACDIAVQGVGALLIAEEALVPGALDCLSELFSSQPEWSDIPVLLLTSNGERIHSAGRSLFQQRGARGNFVVIERPVRRLTLR